jgi:hypothetical protein
MGHCCLAQGQAVQGPGDEPVWRQLLQRHSNHNGELRWQAATLAQPDTSEALADLSL